MPFKFKLGFCTDLHGSEYTFRRTLNIAKSKKIDYLIISGGLTAKDIVFVEEIGGMYLVNGKKVNLKNLTEDSLRSGKYLIINKKEVIDDIKADKSKLEKTLAEIIADQFSRWIKIADEIYRLDRVLWSPAHGDIPQLDDILRGLGAKLVNDSVSFIEDVQLVSLGYGSPIQNSYREVSDSDIYIKGKSLLKDAEKDKVIMNFHMPPLNSKLDVIKVGFKKLHAGSKAVLDLINEYQPFVSLHGHVHESAGVEKIGNTTAINPGSIFQLGEPSIVLFDVYKEVKTIGTLSIGSYVIKNIEFVTTATMYM
ncbi:MAG: phosphoesterase [Saccharolobus sp.]|jgi:Icc-related predicted phosphoesterase|uniref:metallophosphoesterase family protein n=1 Tax=Saccharolobus sp. TaxID=2100761 RepID=UPI0028CE12C2|nr:phosphoesterase [Saccharolobus sp.]MDT7862615.1 phosphoesterase [Saccharolobus sp.]